MGSSTENCTCDVATYFTYIWILHLLVLHHIQYPILSPFPFYPHSHSIPAYPLMSYFIYPLLSPFYPHSIPMSLKIRHPKIQCFIIMFLIYPYIRTIIWGGVTPFVRHTHSSIGYPPSKAIFMAPGGCKRSPRSPCRRA